MKKKIISLLMLIIILTQLFSAVFAQNNEEKRKTLTEYLIENDIDENNDGKISDEEWKKVKNLCIEEEYIYNNDDLKNISKAVNLKKLQIATHNNFLNYIDFSKLHNLEDLLIDCDEADLSKISNTPNLKSLQIYYDGDMSTLDFSKLEKLEDLIIHNTNIKSINFPRFNNIKYIDINCTYTENNQEKITDFNLDLENCADIYGDIKINDYNKLKLNENIEALKSYDNTLRIQPTYNIGIYKEEKIELEYNEIICEQNDIIEIAKKEDKYYISGKNIGTQKITVIDSLNRRKNIEVEVLEKDNPVSKPVDTKLENTGLTARFVYFDTVLKSNGELWQVTYSPRTVEKIDTNVKDFNYCLAYGKGRDYVCGATHTRLNKLDNNNTLTIKITDNEGYTGKVIASKTIKNVKEIGPNIYLTINGELFETSYNWIKEEITTQKIKEHVKKIVEDCIVLDDGTTWGQYAMIEKDTGEGVYGESEGFFKIADFEIKAAGWMEDGWCIVSMNNELYGFECDYNFSRYVENNRKAPPKKLLKSNFNDFYTQITSMSSYLLIEKVDKTAYLDNIDQIQDDIYIRKDGTIWTYDEEHGLTKITESTPSEDEDEDKNFLNPTAQIHEKELGNKSILYGISEETKVEEFKKQNNFNNMYAVKMYDKNDKELQDNNLVGTGSKVKLYKQGKLVKEYIVILYGDVTGEGKITSVDALAVIKHINNKVLLKKDEYIEAGRVRKESKTNLISVDALAIIKAVNKKFIISKNK